MWFYHRVIDPNNADGMALIKELPDLGLRCLPRPICPKLKIIQYNRSFFIKQLNFVCIECYPLREIKQISTHLFPCGKIIIYKININTFNAINQQPQIDCHLEWILQFQLYLMKKKHKPKGHFQKPSLTHICLVDSSILIYFMGLFPILGVSGSAASDVGTLFAYVPLRGR